MVHGGRAGSRQGAGLVQRSWDRAGIFIAALVVCGLMGMAVLAIRLRRVIRHVAGAVLGLGFLVTFVALRAASFHHVDQWLGSGVVRPNWVLELSGIALIAMSAWRQTHISGKGAPS